MPVRTWIPLSAPTSRPQDHVEGLRCAVRLTAHEMAEQAFLTATPQERAALMTSYAEHAAVIASFAELGAALMASSIKPAALQGTPPKQAASKASPAQQAAVTTSLPERSVLKASQAELGAALKASLAKSPAAKARPAEQAALRASSAELRAALRGSPAERVATEPAATERPAARKTKRRQEVSRPTLEEPVEARAESLWENLSDDVASMLIATLARSLLELTEGDPPRGPRPRGALALRTGAQFEVPFKPLDRRHEIEPWQPRRAAGATRRRG